MTDFKDVCDIKLSAAVPDYDELLEAQDYLADINLQNIKKKRYFRCAYEDAVREIEKISKDLENTKNREITLIEQIGILQARIKMLESEMKSKDEEFQKKLEMKQNAAAEPVKNENALKPTVISAIPDPVKSGIDPVKPPIASTSSITKSIFRANATAFKPKFG